MSASTVWGHGLRRATFFVLGIGFGWRLAWQHWAESEPTVIIPKAAERQTGLTPFSTRSPLLVSLPPGFESVEGWQLRDLGSPDQQLRAALATAERIPLGRMQDAMRDITRMNGLEGLAGRYFQMALSARWAEAFPGECLREAEVAMRTAGIGLEPFTAVKALAASHPDLALAQLGRTRDKKGRFAELWTVAAEELAWSDPQGAKEWMLSLPSNDDSEKARLRFLWGEDRDEARRYAVEKGNMDELLALWSAEDPAEGVRWSIEAGQPQVSRGAVAAWVRTDPDGCRAYFEGLTSAAAREVFLVPLGQMEGQDDPLRGIAWLSAQPTSEARGNAIGTMAYNWAGSDPEAASAWISTLPPSSERDKIVAKFARAAVLVDPAMAMQWAATIADASQARANLQSVYREWSGSDPKGAAEWLATSPLLADEVKAELKME